MRRRRRRRDRTTSEGRRGGGDGGGGGGQLKEEEEEEEGEEEEEDGTEGEGREERDGALGPLPRLREGLGPKARPKSGAKDQGTDEPQYPRTSPKIVPARCPRPLG